MSLEFNLNTFYMLAGFMLAAYSCVANDVIQTLGTFLSSNEKKPAFMIWAFVSTILIITLTIGWVVNSGDMSFGRLTKIPFIETLHWWHVFPPVVLLFLTRFGMPVSTTFLLLMIFTSDAVMSKMIIKSIVGYVVAFASAIVLYTVIARKIEKYFLDTDEGNAIVWTAIQWASTGFLWTQWIMHDVANIFVYLPRSFSLTDLILTLAIFVSLLGIVCFNRGGEIQKIVRSKTNTTDIRSASIIDFLYGFILVYFKHINSLPMSTTWVFIGVLAGREIAIYNRLKHRSSKEIWRYIIKDFLKVLAGLIVSVLVVKFILLFSSAS